MTNALIPFGHVCLGCLPGWMAPGAGGYQLYRGEGEALSVNWDKPIGFAQAAAGQVTTPAGLGHELGAVYTYGIRRVGHAGILGCSTHVLSTIRRSVGGEMQAVLAGPADVAISRQSAGMVALHWRVEVVPGLLPPDEFEVLSSDGQGGWLEPAVAVVAARRAILASYRVVLSSGQTEGFGVRPRSGQQVGDVVGPVQAPSAGSPVSLQLL